MTARARGRHTRDAITPVPRVSHDPQHHGYFGHVLRGLLVRLHLASHADHHGHSTFWVGVFALFHGGMSMVLMSLCAVATHEPLVFPSLGPTAFMLFFEPLAPTACPRNTIVGHAIGVAAGYVSLALFGLTHAVSALQSGVSPAWVASAALSLALTTGVMIWSHVPHPPAGATTLIVSLGIVHKPDHLVVLMAAILLLVAEGFAVNRLAGIPYPAWGPRCSPP